MCCCKKPNVNGEPGYSWDGKSTGIRHPQPPDLESRDTLIYDLPGRCGGVDAHCHDFRIVTGRGYGLYLLTRNGSGQHRVRIACDKSVAAALAALDDTGRYWIAFAIYHAHAEGQERGASTERTRWNRAALDGRIKVRKSRGSNSRTVTIMPEVAPVNA